MSISHDLELDFPQLFYFINECVKKKQKQNKMIPHIREIAIFSCRYKTKLNVRCLHSDGSKTFTSPTYICVCVCECFYKDLSC